MTQRSMCGETPMGSLHDEAHREADIFKWLESERRRQDVGVWAYREWARRYWTVFLRGRWLQHLFGHRRYSEFDDDSFGRLGYGCELPAEALEFVIDRFLNGCWENLDYFWSSELCGCSRKELVEILDLIGINHLRRIDPPMSMIEAA